MRSMAKDGRVERKMLRNEDPPKFSGGEKGEKPEESRRRGGEDRGRGTRTNAEGVVETGLDREWRAAKIVLEADREIFVAQPSGGRLKARWATARATSSDDPGRGREPRGRSGGWP